jgi:DMSO/TMAO reductase YedYZ molybdopterin-dependent catalytic subunit
VLTRKWPVLTYGVTPQVDLETWSFRCFGLIEKPVSWSWREFLELPRTQVTSDVRREGGVVSQASP